MNDKTSTTVSVILSLLVFSVLLLKYPEQRGAIIFIGTVPILFLSFALAYLVITAITKFEVNNFLIIIKQYRQVKLKKMLAVFLNLTPLEIESSNASMKCLLLELPKYCEIDGTQLIIKRRSAADFWIILFLYLFIAACFVVLFRIVGPLDITLFIAAFFTFIYFFMKPHYFPSVTEINFLEKNVRLKGPSFSRWHTFSVESTHELLSTSTRFYHRARYVLLNIQLGGNTYCLKEFGAGMYDYLQLETESLKSFIEQGLSERISPQDLLKKINIENPNLSHMQAIYRSTIRKKRLLFLAQLLTIIASFIILLLFL